MRPTSVIASMLAALVCLGNALAAQAPGELHGRVLRAGELPVDGASIRLMRDTVVRETRSAPDGQYRLLGVGAGSWTFAVRAIGHRPLFGRLTVDGNGLARDFVLERTVVELDTVVVRDSWTGLRFVVGDARGLTPIAGAKIEVLSSRGVALLTDSTGRAQLERPRNAQVTFTVSRAGYAPRLMAVRTPDEGTTQVTVVLDSVGPNPVSDIIWREMMQRQRWGGSGSANVGQEELARTGASSLTDAIYVSPSAIARGIGLYRNACVFIDGVPHTGTPPDAVPASEVEFIELFPPGTDWSTSLDARLPRGGQCGAPVSRGEITRPNAARYIVIWTRSGRRGAATPR